MRNINQTTANVNLLESKRNICNYYAAKKFDLCEKLIMDSLAVNPHDDELLYYLALIKFQASQNDIAIFLANKALELNKTRHEYWFVLGTILLANNQFELAINFLKEAVALNPNDIKYIFNLATAYLNNKESSSARDMFERALKLDPNNVTAKNCINAIAGKLIYQHDDYDVKGLFEQYSTDFDHHLLDGLEYKVPTIIRDYIKDTNIKAANAVEAKILDLGCGTGIVGEELKKILDNFSITGIDLSPKMLEIAKQKKIYKSLKEGELSAFTEKHKKKYDIVIAADVFVYCSDLDKIFNNIKNNMFKPNSQFIFTIENGDDAYPYTVRLPSSRYAHSRKYIEELAEKYDYKINELRPEQLRKEAGKWMDGYLISLSNK